MTGSDARGFPALREPLWHSAGEHEMPVGVGWLSPSELERAATLRFTKRRNDYLLGRFTGKSAVAGALGLACDARSLRRIEIRNRASGVERGAPELYFDGSPAPLDLSITDRAGWGVCMLTPPGLRVGCDLELVEMRSEAFLADYLTEREHAFVRAGTPGQARWVRGNLLWSAKESVLKVLRTGLRRDTRSVEVEIPGGAGRDGWCRLRARSTEGREFAGWWRRFGAFLLTSAFDAPRSPPRTLVDPPGLQRARPSHTWMHAPIAGQLLAVQGELMEPRIGLVLGGGGVIGNAYITGVLEGLRRATGWDPIHAELTMGTSAGSVNGGLLAAGVSAEIQFDHVSGELEPAPTRACPVQSEFARRLAQQGDLDWMARLYPRIEQKARPVLASPRSVLRTLTDPRNTPIALLLAGLLPEGSRSTKTIGQIIESVVGRGWPRSRFWAVATDLESGSRVPFGQTGSPATDLSRAVRASCAIPSFFAPVRVQGRRFVDGGVWSVSNLDLVRQEQLDLVVCVNPLSPSHPRPAELGSEDGSRRSADWVRGLERRAWDRFARRLASERSLVEASGTPVLLLQPSVADLEVIPMNWMEALPRRRVASRALETTFDALAGPGAREAVARLRDAAP